MIRALALAVGLTAAACAADRSPRLPDSRLLLHVNPAVTMADIHGLALITITVGGIAGASVSCATIRLEIDGELRSSIDPDCAPEDVDEDGGVVAWQIPMGQGEHTVTVEAQEPGRRPMRAWRSVDVR